MPMQDCLYETLGIYLRLCPRAAPTRLGLDGVTYDTVADIFKYGTVLGMWESLAATQGRT